MHWDENDGRAPDTEDALVPHSEPSTKSTASGKVQAKRLPKVVKSGLRGKSEKKSESVVPVKSQEELNKVSKRCLRSYKWENNSCFFDVGLEIWFRCFAGLSPELQNDVMTSLPKESLLEEVFKHFHQRLNWIETGIPRNAKGMLEDIQKVVRDTITFRYELHRLGDYGCGQAWLNRAIIENDHIPAVTQQFWVQYTSHFECNSSHKFVSHQHHYLKSLMCNDFDIQQLYVSGGQGIMTISLNDYLQYFVPRFHGQGPTSARALPPVHLEKVPKCPYSACVSNTCELREIRTEWPKFLHVSPPVLSSFEAVAFEMSHILEIPSVFGSKTGPQVVYELVGRVIFSKARDHFTAQLLLLHNGKMSTFDYDDLEGGNLRYIGDESVIDAPVMQTLFHLYRRTSQVASVSVKVERLKAHYAKGEESWKEYIRPVIELDDNGTVKQDDSNKEKTQAGTKSSGPDDAMGSPENTKIDIEAIPCDGCGSCIDCKETIEKL